VGAASALSVTADPVVASVVVVVPRLSPAVVELVGAVVDVELVDDDGGTVVDVVELVDGDGGAVVDVVELVVVRSLVEVVVASLSEVAGSATAASSAGSNDAVSVWVVRSLTDGSSTPEASHPHGTGTSNAHGGSRRSWSRSAKSPPNRPATVE
jgi:hypothetical protein